ncbi:MAG TPA: hypothetical protein VFS43_05990 [Polyangiaceae bacterium]|nr:hypothetical protein [Polyangiaceae bacterium]
MGSVPDGWWRDKRGAAERLCTALEELASGRFRRRLPPPLEGGPLDVVLVVEGAARGVRCRAGVEVVDAPGSGDDTIVELARQRGGHRLVVVATADRELIGRVRALGASVIGPRSVHPRG